MRFESLSTEEIVAAASQVCASLRSDTVMLVGYLADIEERRAYVVHGYSSMFDFCRRRLELSPGQTHRRLVACRLVQRFPILFDALVAKRLHLTSLAILESLFTPENVETIVNEAEGKTMLELQHLVARRAPKPDVAPALQKLTSPRGIEETASPAEAEACAAPRARIAPLSPDRYELRVTIGAETYEAIEEVRELMRHRNPSGDLAELTRAAFALLRKQLRKERLGETSQPRRAKSPKDPGAISASARREVVARDGAQCSYVAPDGTRCTARGFLELDHRDPRARGGLGNAENLRMLCRTHNRFFAEQVFGRAFLENKIHVRQRTSKSRGAAALARPADSWPGQESVGNARSPPPASDSVDT